MGRSDRRGGRRGGGGGGPGRERARARAGAREPPSGGAAGAAGAGGGVRAARAGGSGRGGGWRWRGASGGGRAELPGPRGARRRPGALRLAGTPSGRVTGRAGSAACPGHPRHPFQRLSSSRAGEAWCAPPAFPLRCSPFTLLSRSPAHSQQVYVGVSNAPAPSHSSFLSHLRPPPPPPPVTVFPKAECYRNPFFSPSRCEHRVGHADR